MFLAFYIKMPKARKKVLARKASQKAKARHLIIYKAEFAFPSSRFAAATVAAHGEYNSTNTHKAAASGTPIREESPAGHITESEETIVSFAKNPESSAEAIRQSPRSIGERSGAIKPPAFAIRLSEGSTVNRKCRSNEQSIYITALQRSTTVPARDINASSFVFIATIKFLI